MLVRTNVVKSNIGTESFKSVLKSNSHKILSEMSKGNIENPRYKIFKMQYIDKLYARLNSKELIIAINEVELMDLQLNDIEVFINGIVDVVDKENKNKVFINKNLDITHSEGYLYDIRFHANQLAEDKYCVFFINNNGVEVFYNGKEMHALNIFFSEKDLIRKACKKHISEIDVVLDEYKKQHLPKKQYIFFEKENLLVYKPEEKIKDDLVKYLNDRLQNYFTVNVPLGNSSNKVIDLYTEVGGKAFIFTVEWLGDSIGQCGKTINEKHDEKYAKKAVIKTLECIKEVKDTKKYKNLEYGAVAIFDARTDKCTIDYSITNPNIQQYESYIKYISEFSISNSIA